MADEDGLGARTTHYLYEPGQFVPVAQAQREEAIELLNQPVHGDYYRRDEDPLWTPPPPAPPIGRLAWYQCDHLGTPQELTDEQGRIAWTAQYQAWGMAREAIRQASDGRAPLRTPIRFQGQYHDHETGLHYNRYRYYDPEAGRFISKDSMGFKGGLNLYKYAQNPIHWVDPPGLTLCKKCFPKCTNNTAKDPKDANEMARELSNQIGKNSVALLTPSKQGHIDLQGTPHFDKATGVDIPTPHVQTRTINVGPDGQITTSKKTEVTVAATKQDIRAARELAR